MFGLGANEFLIILVIVVLLFGGKKIPELFRGVGRGVGELQKGLDEGRKTFERGLHEELSKDEPESLPAAKTDTPKHANS